VPLDCQGGES